MSEPRTDGEHAPRWTAWLDLAHPAPLPTPDLAARRTRLRQAVAGLVDDDHNAAMIVSATANVRWATGYTGTNGWLLVLEDRCVLLTDHRYEGQVLAEPGLDVVITRAFADVALQLTGEARADRLAFEGDHLSHRAGVALQDDASDAGVRDVIAAHGLVERERTTKDDAELARLARACAITEAVLDDVLAAGLVGRTERAIARAVEDGMRDRDAEVGFPSIVASGPNGAVPHHVPTDRVVASGDLVTIDVGARVDGYHADTTRTVAAGALPGGAQAHLAEVFAAVADAQQAGVEAVTPGAHSRDVDRACRDHLTALGHGDAFVHGTGHGVGLEIHEAPAVASTAAATLRPRTALTVEPGVYLPGHGGVRIEDTVVVSDEGPARRLTHSPRTLRVV